MVGCFFVCDEAILWIEILDARVQKAAVGGRTLPELLGQEVSLEQINGPTTKSMTAATC